MKEAPKFFDMKFEDAHFLSIQDGMCHSKNTDNCAAEIEGTCDNCILNADLGEFKLWLNEVTK